MYSRIVIHLIWYILYIGIIEAGTEDLPPHLHPETQKDIILIGNHTFIPPGKPLPPGLQDAINKANKTKLEARQNSLNQYSLYQECIHSTSSSMGWYNYYYYTYAKPTIGFNTGNGWNLYSTVLSKKCSEASFYAHITVSKEYITGDIYHYYWASNGYYMDYATTNPGVSLYGYTDGAYTYTTRSDTISAYTTVTPMIERISDYFANSLPVKTTTEYTSITKVSTVVRTATITKPTTVLKTATLTDTLITATSLSTRYFCG